MPFMRFMLSFFVCVSLVAGQSDGDSVDPRFAKIRKEVLAGIGTPATVSVAVSVMEGKKILWEEAFGTAVAASKSPATVRTAYPVASLSKSLAATGLMVLVQRGKVGLDVPVERYLGPGAVTGPACGRAPLTPRTLLSMEGGVPHGWSVHGQGSKVPDLAELVRRHCIVAFQPGKGHLYSNMAYGVVELLIERVSKMRYSEFMRREVFAPLGMEDASADYEVRPGRAEARGAITPGSDRDPVHFLPRAGAGAYASVRDIRRFGRHALGVLGSGQSRVLSAKSLAEMHRPAAGLGFGVAKLEDGTRWIVSNGSMTGSSSMLTLLPDQGVIIAVVVTGRDRGAADRTATRIADAFRPGFSKLTEAYARKFGERHAFGAFKTPDGAVGPWIGTLELGGKPLAVSLHLKKPDHVTATLAGHPCTVSRAAARGQRLRIRLQAPDEEGIPLGVRRIVLHLEAGTDGLQGCATVYRTTDDASLALPHALVLKRKKE